MQYFDARDDDLASIRIAYPASIATTVPLRLQKLSTFGALCALMLVSGQSPAPLDPCIVQLMVYSGDLHSLHPRLVGEWHPELRATILSWLSIGPTGDPAPFAAQLYSYHNVPVCLLGILCFFVD